MPKTFLYHAAFPALIAGVFFIIPLCLWPAALDPAIAPRFIILSAICLVLGSLSWINGRGSGFFSGSTLALPVVLAGYAGIAFLSIIWSINKAEAAFAAGKIFVFAAVIALAIPLLSSNRKAIAFTARAATLSSVLISIIGIFEYWGIVTIINGGWIGPGATMLNRNLFASYLFLCLPFVLYNVAVGTGLWRISGIAAFGATMYAVIITQTRAVWIGCLLGTVVTVAIMAVIDFRKSIAFPRRQWRVIAILATVALIAVSLARLAIPADWEKPSLRKRAASIFDPSQASNRERLVLWGKTIRMIRDHPLRGAGAGNWKIMLPRYGIGDLPLQTAQSFEVRPYNEFLGAAAETGIIGLLLFIGIFACGMIRCITILRGKSGHSEKLFCALALFGLCGFAGLCFFDFPFERIEHLAVFGILLACCFRTDPAGKPVHNSPWIHRTTVLLIHAGVAICVWLGCMRLNGDIHASRMLIAWNSGDWGTVAIEAGRARSIGYTLEPSSTPLDFYRGAANFRQGKVDPALQDYLAAFRFHPWHPAVLNDLGACYNALGDRDRAMDFLQRSLSVNPHFESALINLSSLFYNSGKYDAAYGIISRCKAPHDDPRFESAYQTISAKIDKRRSP